MKKIELKDVSTFWMGMFQFLPGGAEEKSI
jgi:hypothetical protein